MRIIKKFITLCVALGIVFSSCVMPQNEAAAEEISTERYLNVLTALGIYDVDDNMDMESESLYREEIASLLSVFYGVTEKDYSVKTDFVDVPEYWASGHIMTMVNNGIMNGYEDGLFRPETEVLKIEAIKMLVCMTGYRAIAEMNGGWPTGYTLTANKIGLLKGISSSGMEESIARGEFNRLLYNAIDVDLYRQTSYNGKYIEYTQEDDITLLTENLDIYKAEGILNGVFVTTIDFADIPGKDRIRIDNTNFECNFDAYPYIGMYIKGYYKLTRDDSIGEILYIENKYDNNCLEVDAEDIVSLSKGKLEYEKGNSVKTVNIPNDAIVIYNGKRDVYSPLKTLTPKQGSIRLVASTNRGAYNCVIIDDYVNYYVKNVVSDNDVYTITSDNGKNPVYIDTKSSDVYYNIYHSGKSVDIKQIKSGMIASIKADSVDFSTNQIKPDSEFLEIHLSQNTVTGKVNVKTSDGDIKVDGVLYKLAKDYNYSEYPLSLGTSYTFYLNYKDEICAYDQLLTSDYTYGLLMGISVEKMGSAGKVKLFNQDGKFIVVELVQKPVIDGKAREDAKAARSVLEASAAQFAAQTEISVPSGEVSQLVKYKQNEDGKICNIDTIVANENPSHEELEFSGRTNVASGVNGFYSNQVFFSASAKDGSNGSSSFAINDDTILFRVEGDLNIEDSVGIYSGRIYNKSYSVKFFDAGDMNLAKVAIACDIGNYLYGEESTNIMIVAEYYEQLNADGEVAPFLKGYYPQTGAEVEIEVESEEVYTNAGIGVGDFIQWTTNGKGAACSFRIPISKSGTGLNNSSSCTTKSQGGSFSADTRFGYGRLLDYDGEYILMHYKGWIEDSNENYTYREPVKLNRLACVFMYDSEKDKLTRSSIDEIRSEKAYGESGADYLTLYYRSNVLYGIVINR